MILMTYSSNLRNSIRQNTEFYSPVAGVAGVEYETPHIVHHETPIYVHSHDVEHYIPPHVDEHIIHHSPYGDHIHHVGIQHPINDCLCAREVRCHPCGEIITSHMHIDCPCAPKLNCPICPPLSLIHEIAAKKVSFIVLTF